jgi:predicted Zn-dependent peptidase
MRRRRSLLAAAAAVLAVWAGARPAPLRAEELKRSALDNGLAVISQRDTASTLTVLEILIRGGQTAEPAGKAGLSYLTTRLAVDIPDQDKVQDFMAKALHYSVSAKADYSVIHLECLSEFFDDAAAAFVEILSDPLFTGVRIDRLKEFMDNQRRLTADDADNAGHAAHLEAFFGNSAYGHSVFGTDDSLKAIKAVDIKDFYGRYFVPGNMTLVAVSDLDESRLAAVLRKRFGGFRKGAPPAPLPPPVSAPANVFSGARDIAKDSLQTLVSAAFALPPLSSRTFILNAVVENTLGRGPGTRLWSLRAELKLAYAVAARATQMKSGGILESTLETEPGKGEEARIALDQALRDFAARGLTPDELEAARAEVKAQLLRGNERKDARAATLGTLEMLGLGAAFFEAFPAELGGVTLEEINAYIKDILAPDRASWVRIGPKR